MAWLVTQAQKEACHTIDGHVVAHVDSESEGECGESVKGKVPRSYDKSESFRESDLDLHPSRPRQPLECVPPYRARKLEGHLGNRGSSIAVDHGFCKMKNRRQKKAENRGDKRRKRQPDRSREIDYE